MTVSLSEFREAMDDAGAPECKIIARETRTARKAHGCTRCAAPIAPGSRYDRDVWLVDGELTVDKRHARCEP